MAEVGVYALRHMLDPSVSELSPIICDLKHAIKELWIINLEGFRPLRAEILNALSIPVRELHHVSHCLLRSQSQELLDIAVEF